MMAVFKEANGMVHIRPIVVFRREEAGAFIPAVFQLRLEESDRLVNFELERSEKNVAYYEEALHLSG